MTEFKVESMSCGGCVRAVTRALQSADPTAKVDVDLATKSVRVESAQPEADLRSALIDAGYAPA